MKSLIILMVSLLLFVSGSLYGINQDSPPATESEPKVELNNACSPENIEQKPPMIAEAAYSLGEGVSHGFNFILFLLYSFMSGK
ncbi:hypothetical protein [Halobacillus seohaensis]|uniref:Uncharacterized protein n=1 Tax=Halobacillus seohaensis TaxID=447421 RepID=A0ABW2EED1_9BACI